MRSTAMVMDAHRAFHCQDRTVAVYLSTYASQPKVVPGSTPLFPCVDLLIIHFKNRTFTWLLNKWMKLGNENWPPLSCM